MSTYQDVSCVLACGRALLSSWNTLSPSTAILLTNLSFF